MPWRRWLLSFALLLVWRSAAIVLADPPADPDPLAPQLVVVLESPEYTDDQKINVCDYLTKSGPRAAVAAPALAALLSRNAKLNHHAGAALIAIGPDAIPALKPVLNGADMAAAAHAAQIWAAIDKNAKVDPADLVVRLFRGQEIERYEAALALGDMLPAEKAVNLLKGARQTELSPLVLEGIDQKIGAARAQDPAEHVREVKEELQSGSEDERLAAIRALAAGVVGLTSRETVAALRRALDDPAADIARTAAGAMPEWRDDALPQLLDALQSHDGYTRRLAYEAMGAMAINRTVEPPQLMQLLKSGLDEPCVKNREAATTAMLARWPQSEPILTTAMQNRDDTVRGVVVTQLLDKAGDLWRTSQFPKPIDINSLHVWPIDEKFADFEAQVTPGILRQMATMDRDQRDRVFATMLALRSRKSRMDLADELVRDMQDIRAPVYTVAAERLAMLGSTAIPALLRGAKSQDEYTRKWSLKTLNDLPDAPVNAEAAELLTTALADPSLDVRKAALNWASRFLEMGNLPPAAAARLVTWINPAADQPPVDAETRRKVIGVLMHSTTDPKIVVPILLDELANTDPDLRLAPVVALRRYGVAAESAIDRLSTFLAPNCNPLAVAAADTLLTLGPRGQRRVVSFLVEVLPATDDPTTRKWILGDLMQIGPAAADAIPVLTPLLNASDNALRIEVARAMGAIGPAAHTAVAPLTRMMDNHNPAVRESACEALLHICPDGKGLGPALKAAVLNADRASAERLAAAISRSPEEAAISTRLRDMETNDPDPTVRAAARHAAAFLAGSAPSATRP